MKVSVIGAGSWGSAIACLLSGTGNEVSLWAHDPKLAETLNATRHNPRYLTEIEFPATVQASADLAEVLTDSEAIVLVTPSSVLPQMAESLSSSGLNRGSIDGAAGTSKEATQPLTPLLPATTPIILLSKGLERETGRLLLDVLSDQLGNPDRLAVLSGPNHAEEVAANIPSATVVASQSEQTALFFQELFAAPTFRVYSSADIVGVQLCAAAKNVIAIACGLATGLGMGDNTLALIMTRGLAEISRLVASQGGEQLTCMGLAGMGDLIATCTSPHSRNRGFGLELAAGGSLEAYQQRTHMVVEGALASLAITKLAQDYDVELPISEVVRAIVWEDQPVDEALSSLLERSSKPEFY
jgi:glycerol-3-phosphate dehydrogenase (NAD(P)+)